ncbi:MAG: vitamin K epoxide reductase family protein [Patescibacteria group bacterium]|nr:vitamin K epoxide reductase family protein [Patescibacteria group bacterium]
MEILIIIFSLLGVFISWYIDFHKKTNKKLVCPLRAECEPVIHSPYSKFLGIKLEQLGIFYYSLVYIFYFSYLFSKHTLPIFEFIFFNFSLLAFLFSIYLTFIQIFKLKKLCSWCLMSAFTSFMIFFLSYLNFRDSLVFISQLFKDISIFSHALFSGIGLGIVIVVDYLFFRFLKDRKIDEKEKEVLDYLSDFIWLILGLIVVTGFFIYLSDMEKYHNSVKFQFKMLVVGIIILNGFLLNLFVSPKLIDLDLENLPSLKEKLAIASGIISISSWFLSFTLGRIKYISYALSSLLFTYFVILLIFILIGLFIFRKYRI